jgi:hypothetical protein
LVLLLFDFFSATNEGPGKKERSTRVPAIEMREEEEEEGGGRTTYYEYQTQVERTPLE